MRLLCTIYEVQVLSSDYFAFTLEKSTRSDSWKNIYRYRLTLVLTQNLFTPIVHANSITVYAAGYTLKVYNYTHKASVQTVSL